MKLIDRLVRPHLRDLEPYSSARDEYTGKEGIFLDANENPFGSVVAGEWNRYPDPYQQDLKTAISALKGIKSDRIFLGNGSDEPIDLLTRAFCEPGKDNILIFPPTYGMYQVSAGIHNVPVKKVYLTRDFQLDVAGARQTWDEHTHLTYVCSPNNPTGNKFDRDHIVELLRHAPGYVVVDEAYIDFAPEDSFVRLVDHYENLIVLQTFSKAWGMAAFRLGMAFAHPDVVRLLNRIKAPYNLSGLVQKQALLALLNGTKMKNWVSQLNEERERLATALTRLAYVQHVHPSDANFLLVRFDESHRVFSYLLEQHIIVRDRSKTPLCEGCLRISVGTPEENDRLLFALEAFN
ncbi:MAG: histidinol-phosphate transaminase [Cyclobacteriaceae bacterium]|nr:histidinol-phosphate transaminase [Cyclobacteriaceae bacterium]